MAMHIFTVYKINGLDQDITNRRGGIVPLQYQKISKVNTSWHGRCYFLFKSLTMFGQAVI